MSAWTPKHLKLTKDEILLYWPRFWGKVDIRGADDCWEWRRRRNEFGYGAFWFRGHSLPAHRISIGLMGCEIPDGMLACHRCDNPPCVNPKHVYVGTWQTNSIDTDRHMRRLRMGNYHPEKTPASKLSVREVREVLDLLSWGGMSQGEIGRHYGVCQQNVSFINRRVTWPHL